MPPAWRGSWARLATNTIQRPRLHRTAAVEPTKICGLVLTCEEPNMKVLNAHERRVSRPLPEVFEELVALETANGPNFAGAEYAAISPNNGFVLGATRLELCV
jgi:hypothetical protein